MALERVRSNVRGKAAAACCAAAAALAPAACVLAAEQPSATGRFSVDYEPPAGGWPLNRPFSLPFTVESRGAASLPSDLRLQVEVDMPAHRHGSDLVPQVREEARGHYRVLGILMHMRGDWRISLTLTTGTTVDQVVIPAHVD